MDYICVSYWYQAHIVCTMKHYFTILFVMSLFFVAYAQRNTGINTTNPSSKAALDVHTDGSLKQGLLVPRLSHADTTALKTGIPNHSKGLLFYDTVNTVYRYWTGSKWQSFGGGSSSMSDWSLSGNTLVAADTQSTGFKYLGTNSAFPLIIATDGQQRMRISRTGNIGIGMNPTNGIPLSLKSNGLGQVFSIVRSTAANLFEFRQDANLHAKLQMYDVDGNSTIEFNADPKMYSYLNTLGFGIGNVAPQAMLDVAGDFATRPTTADLSATDVIYALPTKGTSVIYVAATASGGTKVHGIADGVSGKHLYITNRYTSPLIFVNNSAEATIDDRIVSGISDYEIVNGQTAHFIYNGGRWRLVSAPSTANALSGTGANNKLAFWNGTSNLTYNTNLHWNNTNLRLGVGTSTPSDPLTVQAGTLTGIGLIGTGSQSTRMYFDATNNMVFESSSPIKFYPNGAGEALHLDDGDLISSVALTVNSYARVNTLGIGLYPSMPLHVQIPLAAEPASAGTTGTGHVRLETADSPIALDMGIADDAYNGGWLQAHYKTNLAANSPLLFNPNGGNVGIGTTNPLSTLHVDGPIATAMTNRTAANQTILATESVVVKGANGACTYTLPPVVDGKVITIVNNGAVGSGNITIASPTIIAGNTVVTPKTFNICVGFGTTWMCK